MVVTIMHARVEFGFDCKSTICAAAKSKLWDKREISQKSCSVSIVSVEPDMMMIPDNVILHNIVLTDDDTTGSQR